MARQAAQQHHAESWRWTSILAELEPQIRDGIPIVGLEPACVSAFRDELRGLFPGNERAERLSSQMLFFSEFVDRKCGHHPLPVVAGSALVQIHCTIMLMCSAGLALTMRLWLQLAAAWPGHSDKYDISMVAAERLPLPKLREAPQNTMIIANGFSCREQIEQGTRRPTFHIAELMHRKRS